MVITTHNYYRPNKLRAYTYENTPNKELTAFLWVISNTHSSMKPIHSCTTTLW